MILDEIKTLLLADVTVAGLVGTAIYDGVLPRGFTLPAVVYHIVSAPSGYDFAGVSDPSEVKLQFDYYGDTAAQVYAVQCAVKAVLQNLRGTLSGHRVLASFWNFDQDMPYEPTINKVAVGFRSLSQVDIWYMVG